LLFLRAGGRCSPRAGWVWHHCFFMATGAHAISCCCSHRSRANYLMGRGILRLRDAATVTGLSVVGDGGRDLQPRTARLLQVRKFLCRFVNALAGTAFSWKESSFRSGFLSSPSPRSRIWSMLTRARRGNPIRCITAFCQLFSPPDCRSHPAPRGNDAPVRRPA